MSVFLMLGDIRKGYPRLAAYLADLPEQGLINLAPNQYNASMQAGPNKLGDHIMQPPHTTPIILAKIRAASEVADPNDVPNYLKAAAQFSLTAVDKPFWEDLPGYRAELVLSPNIILHGLLRFW